MDEPVDTVDKPVRGGPPGPGSDRAQPPDHPPTDEPPRGIDLARRALDQARQNARARGQAAGARTSGAASGSRTSTPRAAAGGRGGRRRWSGPGADDRDPQPLGRLTTRLVRARGWSEQVSAGTVLGRWPALVGADIAAHAEAVSLRDGELLVRAESTAWATQLRLMQRQLLATLARGVGDGVVTRLTVVGPAAPSWRKGERHVRGRGPRDTYG